MNGSFGRISESFRAGEQFGLRLLVENIIESVLLGMIAWSIGSGVLEKALSERAWLLEANGLVGQSSNRSCEDDSTCSRQAKIWLSQGTAVERGSQEGDGKPEDDGISDMMTVVDLECF
jgi:hypothetical protein